ncbi:hypothetical protein BKA70DRAFT_1290916 [Coprinopsis sp. MPI-PUGE-AT-0042]|nr:hypothetical protein BKA70DRAFT_1290916 [Coprinopsis sp. MPI-PUGE-AT-0042]
MSTTFPPEIIHKIIDNLKGNPSALKTCSLVCSDLQVVSQRHLFSTVRIEIDKTDKILRLQHLSSSPRLVSYIRTIQLNLYIGAPKTRNGWLKAEGPILLNFLQMIAIDGIHCFSFVDSFSLEAFTVFQDDDPPIVNSLWSAIGNICAGASLHTFGIASTHHLGVIQRCGRSLKELYIHTPSFSDVKLPQQESTVPIHLGSFALSQRGDNIWQYMLSGPSPFNFHHLTYLHLRGTGNEDLQAVLDQCKDTLATLILVYSSIEVLEPSVGLAKLQNLKSLHLALGFTPFGTVLNRTAITERIRWLTEELSLLNRPSSLEQLANTYLVGTQNPFDPQSLSHWDALSDLLSTSALFPNLQEVEICVELWSPHPSASLIESCTKLQQQIDESPFFKKLSAKEIMHSSYRKYGEGSTTHPRFLPKLR